MNNKKTITGTAITFWILTVLSFTPSIASATPKNDDLAKINTTYNNPNINIGDNYSDWAYTPEFSKRFKLNADNVETMPQGLFAVEFRAVKSKENILSHECYFDLYVDSELGIQYPEDRKSGSLATLQQLIRSIPFDRRGPNDKLDLFASNMYLAATSVREIKEPYKTEYQSRGGIDIFAYRKNAYPSVNYISLKITICSDFLPSQFKSQFLFRKKGVTAPIPSLQLDKFIKLAIPDNFHQRICPYIEKIAYLTLNKHLNNAVELRAAFIAAKNTMNNYPLSCYQGKTHAQ